jgi:hypothetical protein
LTCGTRIALALAAPHAVPFSLDLVEGVHMNETSMKFRQPAEAHAEAQQQDDLEVIFELNFEELGSVAGGPQIINEP